MEDSDKDLLELAAKAIGVSKYRYGDAIYPLPHVWNPLTDDGDALRLAVKLEMDLDLTIAMQPCSDVAACDINVECGKDPYAATRRAIVLAAAEIGKQKE